MDKVHSLQESIAETSQSSELQFASCITNNNASDLEHLNSDALLAENFQLKDEISLKADQIEDLKFTISEYTDRVMAESEKNRILQLALNQTTLGSSRLQGGKGKV